ncbi:hypothetical protein ACILD6_09500 [Capnocytophaga canimorsus]|uniref:Uncharacterized protein n=1 Tax=Capnocytophaga canis TaxID=1848903 RepID=A0A0B7I263_9FLAO|nr:hypothetical protein [Capnocytophaga canis]CEN44854.1 conserved exported hypothetical protein [Capnocytophaga canis]
MKRFTFLLCIAFLSITFGQEKIKVTSVYGSENKEVQVLLDFENIYIQTLTFHGATIKGKHYEVTISEYENGNLVRTETLFDGSESDYFRNQSNTLPLTFFFKMADGKFKGFLRGERFGSKKVYFDLKSESDMYVLKDFFGSSNEWFFTSDTNKATAIFAIITPKINPDGSGSYCEVAQSDIAPERFGTHFLIPHYFLVSIRFKEK